MLAGFVERQEMERRERKSQRAEAPVWNARLENHGSQADAARPQPRPNQIAILTPCSANMVGNPFYAGWSEFRNDDQRQLRKDGLEPCNRQRDDRIGCGSEENLDFYQISCGSSKLQRPA